MPKYKFKLIIWDFDGVIADTENHYLQNRLTAVNEILKLNWDLGELKKHICGMSDVRSEEVFKKLGIATGEKFWHRVHELDKQMMNDGFSLNPGIEKILSNQSFRQCIATGGNKEKTAVKMKVVNAEKYFKPENIFTGDLVAHGKPEPDLFLLAAEKMGVAPQDCIVVEDSIAGLKAGLKAKMHTAAYIGCAIHNNDNYRQEIANMGIEHIFDDMDDFNRYLLNQYEA